MRLQHWILLVTSSPRTFRSVTDATAPRCNGNVKPYSTTLSSHWRWINRIKTIKKCAQFSNPECNNYWYTRVVYDMLCIHGCHEISYDSRRWQRWWTKNMMRTNLSAHKPLCNHRRPRDIRHIALKLYALVATCPHNEWAVEIKTYTHNSKLHLPCPWFVGQPREPRDCQRRRRRRSDRLRCRDTCRTRWPPPTLPVSRRKTPPTRRAYDQTTIIDMIVFPRHWKLSTCHDATITVLSSGIPIRDRISWKDIEMRTVHIRIQLAFSLQNSKPYAKLHILFLEFRNFISRSQFTCFFSRKSRILIYKFWNFFLKIDIY